MTLLQHEIDFIADRILDHVSGRLVGAIRETIRQELRMTDQAIADLQAADDQILAELALVVTDLQTEAKALAAALANVNSGAALLDPQIEAQAQRLVDGANAAAQAVAAMQAPASPLPSPALPPLPSPPLRPSRLPHPRIAVRLPPNRRPPQARERAIEKAPGIALRGLCFVEVTHPGLYRTAGLFVNTRLPGQPSPLASDLLEGRISPPKLRRPTLGTGIEPGQPFRLDVPGRFLPGLRPKVPLQPAVGDHVPGHLPLQILVARVVGAAMRHELSETVVAHHVHEIAPAGFQFPVAGPRGVDVEGRASGPRVTATRGQLPTAAPRFLHGHPVQPLRSGDSLGACQQRDRVRPLTIHGMIPLSPSCLSTISDSPRPGPFPSTCEEYSKPTLARSGD